MTNCLEFQLIQLNKALDFIQQAFVTAKVNPDVIVSKIVDGFAIECVKGRIHCLIPSPPLQKVTLKIGDKQCDSTFDIDTMTQALKEIGVLEWDKIRNSSDELFFRV